MMDAKLVVVGGDAKATEIKLSLPTIIGRGRDASLMLPHPLISRQHCEITEADGWLIVRDMGSLNGTFIGSRRIRQEILAPGELLTIGTVTFRAVYGDAANQESPFGDRPAHVGLPRGDAAAETVPVDPTASGEDTGVDDVAQVRDVGSVDDPGQVPEADDLSDVEIVEEPVEVVEEDSGNEEDGDLQAFLKGLG